MRFLGCNYFFIILTFPWIFIFINFFLFIADSNSEKHLVNANNNFFS